MKYKVGDKVRIKNLDWYDKNKDIDGDVPCSCNVLFLAENKKYLGTTQTIETIYICEGQYVGNYIYKLKGIENTDWTDEMIEGLAEEESKKEVIAWMPNGKLVAEKFNDGTITAIIDKFKYNKLSINTEFCDDKVELVISSDFELKQEGGKWFAIKKKKKYPKTYEECAKILLDRASIRNDLGYKGELLVILQKLLVCRDAYWKIAGEEMGLGKPWKPDWSISADIKYVIEVYRNNVRTNSQGYFNTTLAFPTSEIRDAFYENFKDLIELCKELL